MNGVTSEAKGLYDGKETLTCTATNAVRRSVGREQYTLSERQIGLCYCHAGYFLHL